MTLYVEINMYPTWKHSTWNKIALYVESTIAPYVNTIREKSDTIRENNKCSLRETPYVIWRHYTWNQCLTYTSNTYTWNSVFDVYVNAIREYALRSALYVENIGPLYQLTYTSNILTYTCPGDTLRNVAYVENSPYWWGGWFTSRYWYLCPLPISLQVSS